MLLKILVDNNPNTSESILSEHGLSVYFEYSGKKFLMDTGASDAFLTNALKIDVMIQEIDVVFISHGHFDHIGGLENFLKTNTKAVIVISGKVLFQNYYSYRHKSKKDIGKDLSFINKYRGRFIFVDRDIEILPGLFVITAIDNDFPSPKANTLLYKIEKNTEMPDGFDHEIIICTRSNSNIHVFSGCAHQGILNILLSVSKKFENSHIAAVVGGFHLIEDESDLRFETNKDIGLIADMLLQYFPDTVFYTGHCTGLNAFKVLKEKMKSQIDLFFSGCELNI